MTYPFVRFPSLKQFIDNVVDKYEAELFLSAGVGPRGKPTTKSIIRRCDGKVFIGTIPEMSDDTIINPHMLRSLCIQLNLNCMDFGLILDKDDKPLQ
jgi:hypothetical protein